MTEERDNALAIAKLEGELKAIEERMETKQAEYRTDISLLAEKMSENIGRIEKDAAKRDTEATQRETRLAETISQNSKEAAQRETRLIFAMIAVVGIGLTIFGFITT